MESPDTLLAIDDHPGELRLIEEAIEGADFEAALHTASGKEEALELLQQQGRNDDALQPDAVLVDWNLGEGTGRDVLKVVEECLSHPTVAIMSSVEHRTEKLQSEVPQADGYFTKPTTAEEYIDIISSYIS